MLVSIKTLLRRGAGLIGVLAVIVIIAVAAARVAAPLLAGQRETVEKLVSMAADRPVRIGAIAAEWAGFSPSLILHDVQVLDADHKPALGFKTGYLKLDLADTFVSRQFRWRELDLVGADVHVVREADGQISVRGLDSRPRAAHRDSYDISVTLRASRVRWEDRRLGIDYPFTDVDVAFSIQGNKNHLTAVLNPPPELGGRLTMVAELAGVPQKRATWQGRSYLKIETVQVAKLPEAIQRYLTGGQVSGEVWSDWRTGRIVNSLGHVDVKHASLAHVDAKPDIWDLDHLQGRFRWRTRDPGWILQLADLNFSRAGRRWVSNTAGFVWCPRSRSQAALSGAFSYARAGDLVALLLRTDKVDAGLAAKLALRSPGGELADVQFNARLQGGRIEHYAAQGRFRDFTIHPTDEMPGFSGADGRFRLNEARGALNLNTRNLTIAHPRLFADPLSFDYLRGRLSWRRGRDATLVEAPALALGNEDLKAQGRVALRLDEVSPRLTMRLALSDGNVAHTARYLPVKTMRPETYEWLSQALVAGRLTEGDVVFNGEIADFPFKGPAGAFEADLKLEQGILDYKPGWPRAQAVDAAIRFRDRSLAVTASRARVLTSIVDGATLEVADLGEGDLRMHAKAHGPVSDMMRYLQRSGLIKSQASKVLNVAGNSRLSLAMRLPLSEELKEKVATSVSGEAEFEDASLRVAPADLQFTGIDGALKFSPKGFRAAGVNARLRGYKVKADIAPGAHERTQISVRGRLSAAALLNGFKHPLLGQIRGASFWRARVGLPGLKKPDEKPDPARISLDLSSSLRGIAVRLPTPLRKRAEARRRLSLHTIIGGDDLHPIRIRYGEDISAVGALEKDIDGLRLVRGEVRIDRGPAVLPKRGIRLKGHLDQLSLTAWRPWFDRTQAMPGGVGADDDVAVLGINASLGHLEWGGSRFKDVTLTVRREALRWLVEVNSPQVKGRIAAPLEPRSTTPLFANLERLYLTTTQDRAPSPAVDPRSLPSLRIACKALRINDLAFSDLMLKTTRIPNGLRVDELNLSAADFQGRAHGAWQVAETGQQHSRFDAELESSDVGSLLDRWGVIDSVREGDAAVEAHLTWPDAPFRFNLQGLNGRVHFSIDQGRLRGLNPGAGRLLGLLNTNAIARRLALDFSDLFRTGFSFDVLKGDLSFTAPNMNTDNLTLRGPSAEINITGRTGLVARDYDLRVIVTPPIMSTLPLPVAGALLGGPGVGAAIFLAEKLASKLGPDVGEATGFVYTVKGSWKDPQIKLANGSRQQPQKQENFPYNQR